jgi:hypothetical protein
VTSDVGQLDSAIKTQKKRRTIPCKLNHYLVVFQRIVSLFSLFLAIGKEMEEQRDIVQEDVGCAGVTRPAL